MIKMEAKRVFFDHDIRRDRKVGETFTVLSEKDAARLEARKKALRTGKVEKPAHVDVPRPVVTKDEAADGPKKTGGRGRYQRRDMTAMDGPTGEEIPLPSSLLEPQPEEQTSTNSEAEPE